MLDAVAEMAGTAIVLSTAGDESETRLPLAAIAEMCAAQLSRIDGLPRGVGRTLRDLVVGGSPGDAHEVAAAVLALVRDLRVDGPVVLLIDDADALDKASGAVVSYLCRRAGREGAGIVVAQTPTAPTRLRLGDTEHVRLPALTVGEARALVACRAPALAPASIDAIVAEGNGRAGRLARLAERAENRSLAPTPLGSGGDQVEGPEDIAMAIEAAASRDQSVELLLRAAEAWLAAGDTDRAAGCVDRARCAASTSVPPEVVIAGACVRAAEGQLASAAAELVDLARDRLHDEPALAARAAALAVPWLLHTGGLADAVHALAAAQLALRGCAVPPDRVAALVDAAAAGLTFVTGEPADLSPLLAFVEADSELTTGLEASFLSTAVALPLIWAEQFEPAAELLTATINGARQTRSTGRLPLPLAALAHLERRRFQLDDSLLAATEAADLAARTQQRGAELFALSELANIHGMRGDTQRCRTVAAAVLDDPDAPGTLTTSAASGLATVELWEGNWDRVVELLEPRLAVEAGDLSPSVTTYHQHLVTAYVQLGRLDEAAALTDRICAAATGRHTTRVEIVVERCRGLVADGPGYDAHFARSVAAAEEAPFSRTMTRTLHALRLATDGRSADAAAVVAELVADPDTETGTARAVTHLLRRLAVPANPDGTLVDLTDAPTLRLFGGLAVQGPRGWVEPTGVPALMLTALALRRVAHVEEVCDLLWPDATADVGRRRLRNVLTRVRQSAGDVIVRRDDRLQLAEQVRVDVREFETAADAGDLERALRLQTGPLLPEMLYEEWVDPHRRRLDVLYSWVRRSLVDRRFGAGDIEGALAVADAIVADDPDDLEAAKRSAEIRSALRHRREAAISR
jgi:hypothetical protein